MAQYFPTEEAEAKVRINHQNHGELILKFLSYTKPMTWESWAWRVPGRSPSAGRLWEYPVWYIHRCLLHWSQILPAKCCITSICKKKKKIPQGIVLINGFLLNSLVNTLSSPFCGLMVALQSQPWTWRMPFCRDGWA